MTDETDHSAGLSELLSSSTISSDVPDGASPHPLSVPRTLARSFTIDGVETSLWVQIFRDRLFFGVSQLQGSLGNFLMCEPIQSLINMQQYDFDVTNLLGAREDALLNVYAKRLCERLIQTRGSGDAPMTIVLGISLHKEKGREPAMFQTVLDLLVKLYQDAVG